MRDEMDDDFAVFILSHGRADNVRTMQALAKGGYTGKWYIIIDNEDDTSQMYYDKFGEDHVIMFDKIEFAKTFDTMDNFGKRNTIVYARNVCFKIAEDLGIKKFLQLDDDYTDFQYRYPKDGKLSHTGVKSLNVLFNYMLDFLDTTDALTVCFAQGGDFIGGLNGMYFDKIKRKGMNTFFCKTDRPMNFVGHINEDVNTYVSRGTRGDLILTITDVMVNQLATQSNSGGMTGAYLTAGTYFKTIYTVMIAPSCTKISMMNTAHSRIHHKVYWNNAVPKIISPKYQKERA